MADKYVLDALGDSAIELHESDLFSPGSINSLHGGDDRPPSGLVRARVDNVSFQFSLLLFLYVFTTISIVFKQYMDISEMKVVNS